MLCHGIFVHRLYDYIWLYVPNGRYTSRIWIWGDDMGISCFPFIPLGFSTHMNLSMLRPLLGICIIIVIDETGRAMVIFLPWCDFPLPDVTFLYRRCMPLCLGDDVTFPAWCDLSKVLVAWEFVWDLHLGPKVFTILDQFCRWFWPPRPPCWDVGVFLPASGLPREHDKNVCIHRCT